MPLPLAEEQLKEEGGQGLGKQRGGWAARRHRQPGLILPVWAAAATVVLPHPRWLQRGLVSAN